MNNTHRGSRFERYVGLSYLIQKMTKILPLKTASPISIVVDFLIFAGINKVYNRLVRVAI